jgi:transketolase
MRNAFAAITAELAGEEEKLVLLSGDIGNRLFNPFKENFPDRFFNCGIAEQNMTGIAAGMALSGLRPVTYTITPFNTYRCYEQIRVDICYQNLPVIIVGVGAGLSYASLGATHHSLEDIAVMRALPNMTVLCPADAVEVRCAMKAALKHDGPVYIRIGKKNEPVVHETEPAFEIGRALVVRQGAEVCILSAGTVLPEALNAADELETKDVSTQVVSMHTVKPLDHECLEDIFKRFKLVDR